jgi:hypothetical protein
VPEVQVRAFQGFNGEAYHVRGLLGIARKENASRVCGNQQLKCIGQVMWKSRSNRSLGRRKTHARSAGLLMAYLGGSVL